MQQYGKRKRGSGQLHPHNECGVCSENKFAKRRAQQKKREIEEQLLSMEEDDDWDDWDDIWYVCHEDNEPWRDYQIGLL